MRPDLDAEGRKIAVAARDTLNLGVVDFLGSIRDTGILAGLCNNRSDERAEPSDRFGFVDRDERVVARPLLVVLVEDRRTALDRERIRTDIADDGISHHPVHALDQRDDGHDGRDRHDVAEHRHERSQLVGPDGLKRDGDGIDDLVHRVVRSARALLNPDGLSVREFTDRREGPRDDLISSLESVQHLEVLLARDADFHRQVDGLSVADRKDTLRLLPRVSGWWLVGRAQRRFEIRSAATAVRRLANHLALVVVEHLAHRQRLNRHCHDVLPLRRRNFRGARESRTDVGHRFLERDDHLERGGLSLSRVLRRAGLDRAVADLRHTSLERSIGNGVDRDLGFLLERDARDLCLVHFDFCFDHRHVGDRQQDRSRVVHRSDDGGLSLFDAAAGHQTVHGCRDDDLIQVVARRRQARLFLLDALLVCFDVLRPGPEIRLANGDLILRFLEVLLRRQSFLPEVLLTLQILARELQVCAALLDGRARPEQGRLGGGNTGLSALQLSLELFRIDLEQELTGLHALTLFDCDPSDAPRSLGRDVDLTLRLHLAGGRDDRFQVARTECFGLNIEAGVATVIQIGGDNRGTNQDDPENDQNLLSCHYRSPRNRT